MKRVSVILTTCQSESTLDRTLNSIFAQEGIGTEFELELLIVDDHSTDSTLEILKQRQLPWFSTPTRSGGPNRGRNIGLDEATGDFIAFVDHDDVWHTRKLKIQLQAASYAPVVLAAHFPFTAQAPEIKPFSRLKMQFLEKNQAFLNLLSQNQKLTRYHLSGIFIHKDLRHLRFEEHFGFQDLDWKLRIMYQNSTVLMNTPLVSVQEGEETLSCIKRTEGKVYSYAIMTLESYRQIYPRAVRCGITKLNFTHARYHYNEGHFGEARKYFKRSWSSILGVLWFIPSLLLGSLNIKRIRVSG